jgi:hypothetical protein
MQVEILAVCDAAAQRDGTLSVVCASENVVLPRFPGKCGPLAIAARVRLRQSESGEHTMSLRLIDIDGNVTHHFGSGKFSAQFSDDRPTGVVNLVFNGVINFQKPGEYAVSLCIDDHEYATVPLYVRQARQR